MEGGEGVKLYMCKDGTPQGTQGIHGHGKSEKMVAAELDKLSQQIRNNNTSNKKKLKKTHIGSVSSIITIYILNILTFTKITRYKKHGKNIQIVKKNPLIGSAFKRV